MSARRLPFDPLERYAAQHYRHPLRGDGRDEAPTADDLAAVLGRCRGTIQRYRAEGLSIWQADRLAIALGTHPVLIWPHRWPGSILRARTAA